MRTQRNLTKYLKTEETDRLFEVIKDARDRAIFRVAHHRGLRASEVGLLQLSDYQDRSGRLFCHRLKGSNSGEYRVTAIEQTSLRAWIRERGTAPGPLFPSAFRRPIGRHMLNVLMRRYCALARIPPEKAHMHALKHSCGTHLCEMEGDVTVIQDHMGHREISNTMIYVQITNRKRDAAADRIREWGRKKSKGEQ